MLFVILKLAPIERDYSNLFENSIFESFWVDCRCNFPKNARLKASARKRISGDSSAILWVVYRGLSMFTYSLFDFRCKIDHFCSVLFTEVSARVNKSA